MSVVNEHFVPDEGTTLEDYLRAGDRTAVHHLVRYEWACEVIGDAGGVRTLLDVACGSGYGSHQMARTFPGMDVTGADYDESAVEVATATYQQPNLTFRRGDVELWDDTIGKHQFDCVVSFDTIEHVLHREIMMQNLVEHLSPDGMLLLSTPVRGANVLNPGWEHHKIEYSRPALYDFLRRYFEEVLHPDNGSLPRREVIDRLNRDDEVVYLLKMNPLVCRGPIRITRPV